MEEEPKKEPKAAKATKPKKPTVKKVAEVVGAKDVFGVAAKQSTTATQKVSEEVLSKIRKALALGLHERGNEREKTHAMKCATRLMQQHGLSHAGAHPAFPLPETLCLFGCSTRARCGDVAWKSGCWSELLHRSMCEAALAESPCERSQSCWLCVMGPSTWLCKQGLVGSHTY